MLVEHTTSNGLNERVCNPCTIMSSRNFTELVSADLGHGDFVGLGVILDGDLSGHASHSGDLASIDRLYLDAEDIMLKRRDTPMASVDEEADVRVHERDGHGDVLAVGEDGGAVSTSLLDEAEDIVPSTTKNISQVILGTPKDTYRPQFNPLE